MTLMAKMMTKTTSMITCSGCSPPCSKPARWVYLKEFWKSIGVSDELVVDAHPKCAEHADVWEKGHVSWNKRLSPEEYEVWMVHNS